MEICIRPDDILDERELQDLKRVLGADSDSDFEARMSQLAQAALAEYCEMLLGKFLPTRANEMRERRLFLLLKHYFGGRLPTEAEIASFFQLTEASSRTLLRDTRTKYRYDLANEILNTIRDVLQQAKNIDNRWRVVIQSPNILEELQLTVSTQAPHLEQITKVRNSASVYDLSDDTYYLLCKYYGLAPHDEAAATAE